MNALHVQRGRSAFTLIELLLVLVILVVLAGIVVLNFGSVTSKKNDAKAKTDIANLETALEMYKSDMGDYPSGQDGLQALITQPGNAANGNGTKWNGPYVKRGLPIDPWGRSYVYAYPGTHNTNGFDLYSTGADGNEGGGDDVDNWSSTTK